MFRNRSVDVHQFAMIPRADIPRSSFRIQKALKTTFDAGYLIPIFCDEVLPGDSFDCRLTAFARMATPLYPIMDNLYLETFFFFVPNRLVWNNWKRFMGEQANPGDTISFTVPVLAFDAVPQPLSIFDYFGLPTAGQATAALININALPFRAYNMIWNNWFRDENLQNSVPEFKGDSSDTAEANYTLLRRGKRHDYFTSCLPWTQKGTAVTLPLGSSAPVKTLATAGNLGAQPVLRWSQISGAAPSAAGAIGVATAGVTERGSTVFTTSSEQLFPNNLFADLSQATAATINQIRQAFQIQKLLERDARGGTRYTEIVRSHFGVISPDARLQRPEYLGGGSTPVNISPIAQTSGTVVDSVEQPTPQGNLAAMGTALAHGHGFRGSFTEHGYIIGLANVRADLTYQQGIRKMWSRRTRYDFYFPVFAHLGEQAVLNQEIYAVGVNAQDTAVFGYQERWAEYRYNPSEITGLFRSTTAGTLDAWHLAQRFTSLPALNSTFIQDNPPIPRVVAVDLGAGGQQFICDMFFDIKAARPMPLYSVPGLVDHF